MASIYERMPFFKAQKSWTEKTPLGDVYKLQSNSPRNKQKAEIHKDSGQFGIEFLLDKTINDFVCGAEKVDLDYKSPSRSSKMYFWVGTSPTGNRCCTSTSM
jgi:hypothetical protein